MSRPHLPLNALKAFEASARHLSFTRAGLELCVTQAAVSHQVKALEERLNVSLFRRLPRGLALTDEGLALLPVVRDSFDQMARMLERFSGGQVREVLTVGVVGTFAVGWLIARLPDFHQTHPFVDLRLLTNNNRVDIAGEGLDMAIRFGDGAWHGTEAEKLFDAPITPLCRPEVAARLGAPEDLYGEALLRSYRADDWPEWFARTGAPCPTLRGPMFDTSQVMIEAALLGAGVALAPASMFQRELSSGRLVAPFPVGVLTGAYWITWLKSRAPTEGSAAFRDWLRAAARTET